ncbi:MAG: amidohydrolase family protein [Acidimicrobiales bacterium]
MSDVVLTNARVFTGVDGEVIDGGAVWVSGRYVRAAGPAEVAAGVPAEVRRVDLGGRFVMPGMTESHAHLSYANNGPSEIDKASAEEAMLAAVDNARMVLGAGFTAAISFGSVHRVDVTLRDAINRGAIPGPRLAAAGRDLGGTGSNIDSYDDRAGAQPERLGLIADGPWAVRQAVRRIRKARADVVKIYLDGENLNDKARAEELTYSDDEVNACVDEAHRRGLRVVCHARGADAVKQAVRAGIDIIGHANYLDDEAVELLRRDRHRVFVGPGIAWEIQFLANCESLGIPRAVARARGYEREVEETVKAVRRLREIGVRVLVGGDYGLNITPHGTNAKDLQYFVELFGMSPTEALLCATRDGGAAFDPNGMVGTLEEGKFADLVVVDGDPSRDVTVLQDHARIHTVMKDGIVYRGLTRSNPYGSDL